MKANNGKYLLLISVHGLIRGHDLQLGRDADTGGQTKYVVDLARSLSEHPDVAQVDLVTRRIVDPQVSHEYAEPIEQLSEKARIVRIDAGDEGYIPKEQLWDYLDSFMDNLVQWLNQQDQMPDLVHSHYADAGYVGVKIANLLSIPLIHTGHSLGRDKRKRLLARGISNEEIEKTYHIGRRIDAEEDTLANAALVITSTRNEIEDQYGLYNYYDPQRMAVIPPGTNLEQFYPPQTGDDSLLKSELSQKSFVAQLKTFLKNLDKPLILALSRADERKNILTLLEAYGESEALQEAANLLIVAGNREDIRDLDSGAQSVLTDLLLAVDRYNLYGKVALPKKHSADEVPEIYRLAAATGGVFVNPALTEPFGLTLLEAAASGLPVVATENGGPVDIIANCDNGELIDPLNKSDIVTALLKLLTDQSLWKQASQNGINGVTKHYSWQAHTKLYMQQIKSLSSHLKPLPHDLPPPAAVHYRERAIFTDLDQNLIGNPPALQAFLKTMRDNRKCVTFGIATGRRIDTALAVMKQNGIPRPDVLISGLGTRIHYGQSLTEDHYWAEHIDYDWNLRQIRKVLADVPGLKPQAKSCQTPFKQSYYYDPENAPSVDEIIALIRQKELTVNVICSFGQYLDILPSRASKGQALRYVSQRLEIPLEQILVAGGSGGDEDMIRGNTLGVVVANRHEEELSQLVDQESIYFAEQSHAYGILEAIQHYDFFNNCHVTPNVKQGD